ncbi:uncharacterized protein [Chironomus tepperi]|uniref:uncharacterized protein n=1 Tax=Chironomus tepperi TaxID=113505 RepID=UPI00391F657A
MSGLNLERTIKMKTNQLITLLLISLICVIGVKSQETCENYNNQLLEASVIPGHIGVFETLEITNALNMTFSTNLDEYFSAELDTQQNEIKISTTASFANYEKENNVTRTVLNLNIRCSSSNTALTIRITISRANNYSPEFTASSYDIKIPTPLAKGTEITAYLGFDDQIAATDYDLYDYSISFTLTGSDLFYVERLDITGVKSTFKARIFTKQQIIKLENDEVEFTLTATDSSAEPKSSSVSVKVFTDPENTFIESPKFSKPLYRGELEKGGALKIEDIQLDASTYDDNVKFEIVGDVYEIISMTSEGPTASITLKEGILPEEVFQQKFVDFIIEAKRDGDKSGFAVVVIDISSPIFTFSFEKSLYEGEIKEKRQELSIEAMKLSTNGSVDGTLLRLSQADAKYFDVSINNDLVVLNLKQEASIDEIIAKTLLFLTVEAVQNNSTVAFTNVIIKTVAILIPQFENNFYTASIENGELQHERILITEESIIPEEEIEVTLIGTDSSIFDVEITGREVSFKLKAEAELPENKSFLNFQIQVNVKDPTKKNLAVVICELKVTDSPQQNLKFSSNLYEGKISQDSMLSLPDIALNIVENVIITLSGKHGNYFEHEFTENILVLKLKDGIDIEQFSTDFYLQITIEASRVNFTSATSNVIIGIERSSLPDSAFKKSLYIGSIDDQRTLQLEDLIIESENQFTNVRVTGDDAEFFSANIQNNIISLRLIEEITEELLLEKTILNAKIVADYEESSITTNLIVKLPRPDQIKKLAFTTSYTSGTIKIDTELVLEIGEFSLNPANYDETVEFTLTGTDAHLFSLDQNSNKILLKLNQGITEEQLNTKKFISLSVIATREGFEDAEHFIFINVEIFDPSESSFENNLYIGQVDDQKHLHLDPITIKSNHVFNDVKVIDDDFEYFNVSATGNQVIIGLAKEITQGLLIQKTVLSTKLMAQYDDIIIITNIIVTLPRPDEIQSLKFTTSYSSGKIVTQPELSLNIDEISLQTGNYNENVQFTLNGVDADLFEMVRNTNKIQLKLKSEISSEMLNGKELLSLILLATRQDFASAEHYVFIYIEQSSTAASDSFAKSLYIGNIDEQKALHVETMTIRSNENFNSVEIIGDDSEFFDATVDQNNVTVQLKRTIDQIILPQKGFLNAKIVAKHDDTSVYTNLVVDLPKLDETKKLSFEEPFTVLNLQVHPELKMELREISLESTNYDETVKFSIAGSDANIFEISAVGNKVLLKLKSGITVESLENKEYFTLTLKATREGFESAEHFIFINVLTPEVVKSNFEHNLYLGNIDNQRVLHLNPLFIDSEQIFSEVILTDNEFEYFAASINQNYVTITLVKEITEDLLLKTSLLSTKVIAKFGDISISTNVVVTLPKVNGDKILRFESPYYIGSLDQLTLDIEDIVLEMNNYDDAVEFTLTGTDKDLFKFEKIQNSLKISLSSDVTQEVLLNRVFLTASIKATRTEFASAETVIFVHLNVIVDAISPIEFDKVIYTGSLTYNNVLVLEQISIASNETELQISHKGDHADKFTINHSNLTDIQFDFIPQSIDFESKFYSFYIEALKFGAPKAYAAVIIEIIDKIQLKFDKVNYFGSFDEHGNLMIDQIPLNTAMTSSDVSFKLVGGQNEFFDFNSTGSAIQITNKLSIAVENLSFVWFYLEAYGSSYYPARTLIVIDFPQQIDTPIDECYDKLDPTQPYFESGSYSFTFMSNEVGLVGQIQAIITDPEDSIVSYGLLFENIFLYDKMTISKGDIMLLVPIPAGFYRMKGIALSMNSRKTAETSILLRVLEPKVCEDGKPITTVQKSLAIVKIEENVIHNQIMYMRIGDCYYEITKVVPDVLKNYLMIDNTTYYLKNVQPFDREDSVFASYNVPQLQVTLHLVCPTTYSTEFDPHRIQPYMSEVFTDEILYSPSITYLNLEILDQNDNAPIFTNPPNVNYRVAFPDEYLIGLIMPKYIFKLEAYDIDDGINAVIRYSTSMPTTFEINAVTGEMYPLRTLPDEPTGFLVTAIDRAGAGLRTTTSIDFIKISSDDVIQIIVDNFANKDIDELALELSQKLEADFRVLSSSQLPFTTNSQVLRFADTQAKTKIYGYAFKTNSLDLIPPNELIELLKELELTFAINPSIVNGCSQQNSDDNDCDLAMWIFAVSFMGTVILIILIAIPLFWYFYLKKRLQGQDSNSNSSKEEIANHFYETDSVRDSEIASEIVEAITEMRVSDAEILGIGVNGVTQDESSTDAERLSNKLMSILEPSSPIPDRKVKFNEMVERIEVIDDHDLDTDDIPAHMRY